MGKHEIHQIPRSAGFSGLFFGGSSAPPAAGFPDLGSDRRKYSSVNLVQATSMRHGPFASVEALGVERRRRLSVGGWVAKVGVS